MFDHADLHRHDLELLADFLANAVFTATAGAGQLVLGQFVDDFDARKIGRLRHEMAKKFAAASQRSDALGLNDDELAFYDALANNESSVW
jgi:hypothetical protein